MCCVLHVRLLDSADMQNKENQLSLSVWIDPVGLSRGCCIEGITNRPTHRGTWFAPGCYRRNREQRKDVLTVYFFGSLSVTLIRSFDMQHFLSPGFLRFSLKRIALTIEVAVFSNIDVLRRATVVLVLSRRAAGLHP